MGFADERSWRNISYRNSTSVAVQACRRRAADTLATDVADEDRGDCRGSSSSLSGDVSAVVAAFRHDDGRVTLRSRLFVPGEDIEGREERDRAPYRRWADQELVELHPGGIVDHVSVEAYVRELCATYRVEEIAVDPALAGRFMQKLADSGLPVLAYPQTPINMGRAAGDLERTVAARLLRHDGDPALRSHFHNVVASRNPVTGLTRMHKARRTDRIDAAVAASMAVSRALTGDSLRSAYNDPEAAGLFTF